MKKVSILKRVVLHLLCHAVTRVIGTISFYLWIDKGYVLN